MINRTVVRICFAVIITSAIINISSLLVQDIKSLIKILSQNDYFSIPLGLTIVISFFYWLGNMFYHWGTHEFKSKSLKRIWFWVLLIGTILNSLGPIIYYIVVFEMKKGLKKDLES